MIDYRAGAWGFHVCLGWYGSLAPRALTMAVPCAALTFLVATWWQDPNSAGFSNDAFNSDGSSNLFSTDATSKAAQSIIAAFTAVLLFILYNRSRTSYNRWWEGGTLLQKTRGEWFNAYSSIMAFTSTKPELQEEVLSYCHLIARLFSLLMCCGLQQVSPYRDRPFEIIDIQGIEPASMDFLNTAPDKVEVILQWIQRSMVLHGQSGVLPVPPPILSRAFQEVSRGIVNLQNARKIADFPYPFPLAQVSMILQLLHYALTPFASALALPRPWAVMFSFFTIFVLWCIHFNALDLEFPFGSRVNDLPMDTFQREWNNSLLTLLDSRASRPPHFKYEKQRHDELDIMMSDASELYVPVVPPKFDKGVAVIKIAAADGARRMRGHPARNPARKKIRRPPDVAGAHADSGRKISTIPEQSRSTPGARSDSGDNMGIIPERSVVLPSDERPEGGPSGMRSGSKLGRPPEQEGVDISAHDGVDAEHQGSNGPRATPCSTPAPGGQPADSNSATGEVATLCPPPDTPPKVDSIAMARVTHHL